MKRTVGMIAVLLLLAVSAALAQNSQLPFPQAANPALVNGSYEPISVSAQRNMPSSMATDVSGMVQTRHDFAVAGSPFPSAADPSMGSKSNQGAAFSMELRHEIGGSPFPADANPEK